MERVRSLALGVTRGIRRYGDRALVATSRRVRDHGREIGAGTQERDRAGGDLLEAVAAGSCSASMMPPSPWSEAMIPCTAGMP